MLALKWEASVIIDVNCGNHQPIYQNSFVYNIHCNRFRWTFIDIKKIRLSSCSFLILVLLQINWFRLKSLCSFLILRMNWQSNWLPIWSGVYFDQGRTRSQWVPCPSFRSDLASQHSQSQSQQDFLVIFQCKMYLSLSYNFHAKIQTCKRHIWISTNELSAKKI